MNWVAQLCWNCHVYPGWMIRSVLSRYTAPLRYRITVPKITGVIRTVLSRCTAPYTVPYYCAQDYGVIQPIYGRKLAVFSSFTVRKRPVNDAVLIDLGSVIDCMKSFFQNSDTSNQTNLNVSTSANDSHTISSSSSSTNFSSSSSPTSSSSSTSKKSSPPTPPQSRRMKENINISPLCYQTKYLPDQAILSVGFRRNPIKSDIIC
jgi:hypothetical protein